MSSPSPTPRPRMSLIEERLSYLEQRDDANTRDILKLKSDNISLQNNIVELKQQMSKAHREKKAAEIRLSKLEAETKDTTCTLSREVTILRGLQRLLNGVLVKEHEGGLKKEIEKSVEDSLKTTNVTLSLIDTGLKDLRKEVKAVREKSTVIEGRLSKTEGDLKTLKNEENKEKKQAEKMDRVQQMGVFTYNMNCADDGTIRYAQVDDTDGAIGAIRMQQDISGKNNSFSIRIIGNGSGSKGGISIGVGPLDYPFDNHPGWGKHSVALHGDNGKIYVELGKGYIPANGECQTWKNGDVIKVLVKGLDDDEVVEDGTTLEITFYVNGKMVAQTPFFKLKRFPATKRMVFMIGMSTKSGIARILTPDFESEFNKQKNSFFVAEI